MGFFPFLHSSLELVLSTTINLHRYKGFLTKKKKKKSRAKQREREREVPDLNGVGERDKDEEERYREREREKEESAESVEFPNAPSIQGFDESFLSFNSLSLSNLSLWKFHVFFL